MGKLSLGNFQNQIQVHPILRTKYKTEIYFRKIERYVTVGWTPSPATRRHVSSTPSPLRALRNLWTTPLGYGLIRLVTAPASVFISILHIERERDVA